MAASEIKFHVVDADGHPDWEHPISKLLENIDRRTGRIGAMTNIAVSLQVTGDAYLHVVDGVLRTDVIDKNGQPTRRAVPQSLTFLEADRVGYDVDPATDSIRHFRYSGQGGQQIYLPNEIIHIRQYWPTARHEGLSALVASVTQLINLTAVSETQRAMLHNGAVPSVILAMEDNDKVTPEQLQDCRAAA